MTVQDQPAPFSAPEATPPLLPRTLMQPEHEAFRRTVRRFFETEVAPYTEQFERDGHIPRQLWNRAGELGLLLTAIPEEYGGMGGDRLFSTVLMEEQGRVLASATGFMLHSDIVAPYILHYGTEEQKRRYLPGMATGERVGAIAMTEPGAGSDLQGIKTRAEDKGDHYLLSGSKIFITNGYLADLVIVVARTGNTGKGSRDLSLLLVETNSEGFSKGKPLKKMGMKGQDTCELFFSDVRVPKENLLGQEGQGFRMLMQELPWERLIIAIEAQAAAEAVFDLTRQYVKERQAFGQAVMDFQVTRHKLAELQTEISLGRTYVDECTRAMLGGKLTPQAASAAKYWVSEMCSRVMDACVQLHGGYGYMWEYPVARAFVDNRAHRIYGGTNEIMKELISRAL
ncbi:acyl-CoA dehydrogenase [Deinococcus carri]|uniref:Acyl-CoA dehydrogenase n=1 Tax=Deinococcus carri TaxID=1211323 RepID=A0ABP9WCS7_9DEIO